MSDPLFLVFGISGLENLMRLVKILLVAFQFRKGYTPWCAPVIRLRNHIRYDGTSETQAAPPQLSDWICSLYRHYWWIHSIARPLWMERYPPTTLLSRHDSTYNCTHQHYYIHVLSPRLILSKHGRAALSRTRSPATVDASGCSRSIVSLGVLR